MKRFRWQIMLGIVMILLSVIFYIIDYLIFKDPDQIFVSFFLNMAFVFVQVLLVSMIINGLMNERERRERMEKIKMVIGAFFSQVGSELLAMFSQLDSDAGFMKKRLLISGAWTKKDFSAVLKDVQGHGFRLAAGHRELQSVRDILKGNRDFLLRILENPTLHEHETFTELLWAVFHLIEEVSARKDLRKLPAADLDHLKNDMARAYRALVHEWIMYMEHLKMNYPYLFSFAVRTNPFDETSNVIIQKN